MPSGTSTYFAGTVLPLVKGNVYRHNTFDEKVVNFATLTFESILGSEAKSILLLICTRVKFALWNKCGAFNLLEQVHTAGWKEMLLEYPVEMINFLIILITK